MEEQMSLTTRGTSALHDNLIHRVNVGDMLLRSAERFEAKEMICDGERRWSYGAFNEWTNRVAHGLLSVGLRAGETLGLLSSNRAEFLATYFACAKIGVVVVPINLLWKQGELGYVLEHSRSRAVVVEASLLEQLKNGLSNSQKLVQLIVIDGDDRVSDHVATDLSWRPDIQRIGFETLAQTQPTTEPEVLIEDRAPLTCLYTSGTTSAPKGVVGSHLAIYLDSLGTAIDTKMSHEDRISVVLPLFHTAQLNAICTPAISVGASMVILRGFDADGLHETLERERITVLFVLPMMVRAIVERQMAGARDLKCLRLVVYAMAAMPDAELRRAIDVLKCDFSLMFGQTEMSPVATFFRPEHQLSHPGAVGTPAANVRVGIMDSQGRLLPQGHSGEIVYRSPQTMTGYLYNDAATDDTFRYGWFHSGDAGHFDADGLLWFEDRFKDIIKTGGENVSSIEIELAIRAAESDVIEAVAIGLPHDKWGEAVTAVVVLRPGTKVDSQQLMAAVRSRLSPFKCPKGLIRVEELPKTATGKIQKAKLRQTYASYYENEEVAPKRRL
jgi:acyl-CoA synthetase (AMP-forming)/AMP-acid ligase II